MSNLEIVNVCKSYRHQEVLRNISLSLPQSSIALLGPNGAGKTTLLRILATLITPDSGIIRLGENEWKNRQEIRPLIGYLPQHFNFYPYLTVHECLEYIATLKNIGKNQLNTEVTRVIEEANLSDFSDKRIRSFILECRTYVSYLTFDTRTSMLSLELCLPGRNNIGDL